MSKLSERLPAFFNNIECYWIESEALNGSNNETALVDAARDLENELTAVKAENSSIREICASQNVSTHVIVDALQADLARVTAERDAARGHVAKLLDDRTAPVPHEEQLELMRQYARLGALRECWSLAEHETFRAADYIQALIDAEESKVGK